MGISSFFIKTKDTIISLAKVLIRSNKYAMPVFETNTPLYILGNGPALKTVIEKDENYFENAHIGVVNGFSTSEYYEKLKPASYFIKDGIWFWISEEEFNHPEKTWRDAKSEGEVNTVVAVSKAIRCIKEKTNWLLHLYVPFDAKNSFLHQYLSENKNIKFVYFNNVKTKGFDSIIYPLIYKKGLGNPQFQNVVCMALFQKINEGFKTIYLAGVNANFHQYLKVGDDNLVYNQQVHFYDKEPTRNVITERDKNGNYTPQPIWKQFKSLMMLMHSFQEINKYATHYKCKICNTSKDSFIDAFERKYIFDEMN